MALSLIAAEEGSGCHTGGPEEWAAAANSSPGWNLAGSSRRSAREPPSRASQALRLIHSSFMAPEKLESGWAIKSRSLILSINMFICHLYNFFDVAAVLIFQLFLNWVVCFPFV